MPPPRLSIVVPCYNEQDSLPSLHSRVTAAALAAANGDHELLLINDGSSDGTWEAMKSLAQSDHRVRCVNLSRNFGHQKAASAGLYLARGARVLLIDADLQDPPELLVEMMALMDKGYDVVYGHRTHRDGESLFKKATASLFYRILHKLADVNIPKDTGDFRLMSRKVVDAINALPEQHRFIRGMVSWVGFRQTPINYHREARLKGDSHYPLIKMLALAMDAITSFSITPLRLISLLAGFAFSISAMLLVYVLCSWLIFNTVRGWTSLCAIVVFLGGTQLLCLGIIGEYLGKVFIESKHRPLFIISEVHCVEPPMHDNAPHS